MNRIPIFIGAVLILWGATACRQPMSAAPKGNINAVLKAKSPELMALPSVTGVYVGLMPDQKTRCLVVMLTRKDASTVEKIPRRIDGHPVRVEISGEIRPLK